MDKALARIQALRDQIRDHDRRYYVRNEPAISDFEYDVLMRELKALLAKHPEYESDDCPTRRVGSDLVKTFKKVTHASPMLSIDNSYNEEEVREFNSRV